MTTTRVVTLRAQSTRLRLRSSTKSTSWPSGNSGNVGEQKNNGSADPAGAQVVFHCSLSQQRYVLVISAPYSDTSGVPRRPGSTERRGIISRRSASSETQCRSSRCSSCGTASPTSGRALSTTPRSSKTLTRIAGPFASWLAWVLFPGRAAHAPCGAASKGYRPM